MLAERAAVGQPVRGKNHVTRSTAIPVFRLGAHIMRGFRLFAGRASNWSHSRRPDFRILGRVHF
jgi:hypothetical protein